MNSLDKKTLLILSNSGGYGGAPRSMEFFAQELSRIYCVHICAENSIHVQNLRALSGPSLVVHALHKGKGSLNMIRNLWIMIRLIKKIKPSKLITNTNKAALFAGFLNRLKMLKGVPKFVFVRDFQWRNQKAIWKYLEQATLLIPSQAVADRPAYLPPWPVVIVPNFVPPAPDYEEPSTLFVTCLAMVSKWKGIDLLVKAFAIAHQQNDQLKLRIVGRIIDQNYFQDIQEIIAQHHLEQSVIFEPYTNAIAQVYQQALLVVNTSISEFGGPETFGRTLIEAWAYKRPVISFDCGGPSTIIDHGVNGILVPEKDIQALAHAIVSLAQNPELRMQMANQGYAKLQSTYSAQNAMSILMNTLQEHSST